MKNTTAGTAVNNCESKTMCGFCGTELIGNPDCVYTTANPLWCPKCQCYPSSVSVGICVVPAYTTPLIAISQDEYNRLKECEQENERYREALAKAREALTHILNTYVCNFKCETACNIDKALCSSYAEAKIIDEALTAIDKAGGGEK